MKRLMLIVALLLMPAVANAWYYAPWGSYYYQTNDGTTAINNKYYRYYCGNYYWAGYLPAATATTSAEYVSFEDRLLGVLERQKKRESYAKLIKDTGLAVTPEGQQLVRELVSTTGGGYGYQYSGQTTYQQGADIGHSLFSLQQLSPNIGQVNIDARIQEQQRTVDRLIEAGTIINAAATDQLSRVVDGQRDIAKIQEAGKVSVAMIQASVTPKTITSTYVAQPTAIGQPQQNSNQPPPQPTPDNSGQPQQSNQVLSLLTAQRLMKVACIKCHSGDQPKAGMDLSTFADWGRDAHSKWDKSIRARVTSRDAAKMMPPPDSGQSPLNADELGVIFAACVVPPSGQ